MKRELVKNIGQVKKLEMPVDWCNLSPERKLDHAPYIIEYAPVKNTGVTLTFYYRGKRIDNQSGQDFLRVLKEPPHQVSAADKELIEMVIRDASVDEWFDTYSIYTEKLNGRPVLFLDGVWRKSNLRTLGLFIDTDKTGTAVQELHFSAPAEIYGDYLEEAMSALESIKWK